MALYSLNGFLNGYNDKLSLNTDPNAIRRQGKAIKIDLFQYNKAKDNIIHQYDDPYDMYDKVKNSFRDRISKVKHKVNDCLTAQDILGKIT